MQIAFRIECPHCNWGYEWRNDFINKGWLALTCRNCDHEFFVKIGIPTVSIETQATQPQAPISGQFNARNHRVSEDEITKQ